MLHSARALSQFSSKEVKNLFETGQVAFKHAGMTVLYATRVLSFGRILVVTSRKVGNAPARNLIRRRLKSLFYESHWYELPYDFIFIIRTPALHYSFEKLKLLCTDFVKQLKPL